MQLGIVPPLIRCKHFYEGVVNRGREATDDETNPADLGSDPLLKLRQRLPLT